ncbi:hypothetical protein O3M35_003180 [Rhynocoris fuscipes]|uniref:cysteine--tRNA ligase n=1 Tax=Rhynocoris fuscipes TaxID=488301 RepID=A0AAW1CQQ1_9HEMI
MIGINKKKFCVELFKVWNTIRHCSGKSVPEERVSGFNTNISLYNSAIKSKTTLICQQKGVVSWYCCGPTVYDSAHIGHACCYLNFDIIRRIMEGMFSQNVVFVMGITDIDDKIIKRANDEGVDFKSISQYYEKEFFRDMNRLNMKKPTLIARVSDHIPDIISFVQKIVDSGYGYTTADGTVNFSVNKYKNYGIFIGTQEESDHETTGKEDSRDFALWKGAKPGEPSWTSPWGEGRPGWHIECSAIASKLLGDCVDIHSGGIDLKFPHHENEETQCCVYHNKDKWVTHWIHSGHVKLKNSVKMSKSLKNTISIDDFLRSYKSDHLRMLCLMIPYRNGIEYGDDVMENAVNVYNKCRNFIDDCHAYIKGTKPLGYFEESVLFQDLNTTQKIIMDCLADDFDTSSAINHIIQFISRSNSTLNQNQNTSSESTSCFAIAAACTYIENFLLTCGFTLSDSVHTAAEDNTFSNFTSILESSLSFRSRVREIALMKSTKTANTVDIKEINNKLLEASDEFRKSLYQSGIELKDYGKSTTWSIASKMKYSKKN